MTPDIKIAVVIVLLVIILAAATRIGIKWMGKF